MNEWIKRHDMNHSYTYQIDLCAQDTQQRSSEWCVVLHEVAKCILSLFAFNNQQRAQLIPNAHAHTIFEFVGLTSHTLCNNSNNSDDGVNDDEQEYSDAKAINVTKKEKRWLKTSVVYAIAVQQPFDERMRISMNAIQIS